MDSGEIKKALRMAVNVGCGFEGEAEDAAELLNLIETNETRIAELEAERRWIPVSEPPTVCRDKYGEFIPYLVCTHRGEYPFRAFWDGTMWGDGVRQVFVTHWMPLPELPEVQE